MYEGHTFTIPAGVSHNFRFLIESCGFIGFSLSSSLYIHSTHTHTSCFELSRLQPIHGTRPFLFFECGYVNVNGGTLLQGQPRKTTCTKHLHPPYGILQDTLGRHLINKESKYPESKSMELKGVCLWGSLKSVWLVEVPRHGLSESSTIYYRILTLGR